MLPQKRADGGGDGAAQSPGEDDDDAAKESRTVTEVEKKGEEDDEILVSLKAILYALVPEGIDKGWKTRGTGVVHLNMVQGYYRIVMRRDAVATTLLNTRVWPGMRPGLVEQCSAKNCISFLGQLAGDKENKQRPLMFRLADEAAAKTLLDAWVAAIGDITAGGVIVPAKTGE
jgi:hypothetical protein